MIWTPENWKDFSKWHRWFTWTPTRLPENKLVWLQMIERRVALGVWEYREAGPKVKTRVTTLKDLKTYVENLCRYYGENCDLVPPLTIRGKQDITSKSVTLVFEES